MTRSRADEILEGWKMVAHTASRPSVAPRPAVSRVAVGMGLLGTAAVVAVLLVALSLRGLGPGPVASPFGGVGSSAGPGASPTPPGTSSPSPVPTPAATPLPSTSPQPSSGAGASASPTAAEAAAAGQAVDRYTADLVNGDFASAWAMLAPETQQGYGSLSAFTSDRRAYFVSVAGRYSVVVSPADVGPVTNWVSGLATPIDLAHAVLVEVDYPAIAQNNAWSLYVVAPGNGGLVLFEVR